MIVTYKVQIDKNGVDVTHTIDAPPGGGPDVIGLPSGAGPPSDSSEQIFKLAPPPNSSEPDGCGCPTVVIFGPTVIRGTCKSGTPQKACEPHPDISFRTLDFTLDKQVASQWCWAAVTASVKNFYSPAGTPKLLQCEVATEMLAKGKTLCPEGAKPNSTPTESVVVSQDDNLPESINLGKYQVLAGINPNPFDSPLSFAKVAAEIDAGRPVVVRIGWMPDSSKGHYIVISGYGSKNSVDYLYVQDPEGFGTFAPYSWIRNNYYLQNVNTGSASLGFWSWTYMLAPHSGAPVAITPPSPLLGDTDMAMYRRGARSATEITLPVDVMGLTDISEGKDLDSAHPGIPLTLVTSASKPYFLTAGNQVALTGELVESAARALTTPQFAGKAARYLRIPGLSLHALWLNDEHNRKIVYPFESFDSTILREVIPMEDLFRALEARARKVARFDDRPSANPELRTPRGCLESRPPL